MNNYQVSTDYKLRVSESYAVMIHKTGDWLKSVVEFGALLTEVADFIGSNHGGNHEGPALQDWLSANCPEIDYKTAMRYKQVAAGCARMMGGGAQAIAALQWRDTVAKPGGEGVVAIDAEVIEKRDDIFRAADSIRKLQQMCFDFDKSQYKGRPGRPKGTVADTTKRKTDVESAETIWAEIIVAIEKNLGALSSAARLIRRGYAEQALKDVEDLLGILKARLAERE